MTAKRMIIDHSYDSAMQELAQTKKQLLQKETENRALKKKLFEWKKMALENEALFQTAKQQYQIQEQTLLTRHKSEMEALTTAHVEKMNNVSKTILSLQQLQHETHDPSSTSIHDFIEDKHKETASRVIYHRQKATDLIVNMNELMSEIETKIHGYVNAEEEEEQEAYPTKEDTYHYYQTSISTESLNDELPSLIPSSSQPLDIDTTEPLEEEENTSILLPTPPSLPPSSSFYDGSYANSPASSRSSVCLKPISPPNRPQHYPRLKTKPTLEHLTKVLPNFLLKNSKSEQWKMSHRRSFINA